MQALVNSKALHAISAFTLARRTSGYKKGKQGISGASVPGHGAGGHVRLHHTPSQVRDDRGHGRTTTYRGVRFPPSDWCRVGSPVRE